MGVRFKGLTLTGCALGGLLLADSSGAAPLTAAQIEQLNTGRGAKSEPVRVHYEAPVACPKTIQFHQQMLQLTPGIRVASPGQLARAVRVTVRERSGGFHGELTVTLPNGYEAMGTFLAPNCERVVTALAVIASSSLRAPGAPLGVGGPYVQPRKTWDDDEKLPGNPYGSYRTTPYGSYQGAPYQPVNPYTPGGTAPSPAPAPIPTQPIEPKNPYEQRKGPANTSPQPAPANPFSRRH